MDDSSHGFIDQIVISFSNFLHKAMAFLFIITALYLAYRHYLEPVVRMEHADAIPRFEPITRAGNAPTYTINGVTYRTKRSAVGYSEVGVASWYGRSFHGRPTANGETYDMYKMTAAHPTLPIPSYVRVTNQSNGKSVIVRINDRGPFVKNRIIDLSLAAAHRLDMVKKGIARVRVTSITADETLSAR